MFLIHFPSFFMCRNSGLSTTFPKGTKIPEGGSGVEEVLQHLVLPVSIGAVVQGLNTEYYIPGQENCYKVPSYKFSPLMI